MIATRQRRATVAAATERTLTRAIDLTGLPCGAVYTVHADGTAELGAHAGFRDAALLEDFFGHPDLLSEALARADGRIMRLGSLGVDLSRARAVRARAGLSFLVVVPMRQAIEPDALVVLGAPRAPSGLPFTPLGHTERVRSYCRLLAGAHGLSPHQSDLLGRAAALHDVGKLTIPEEILTKPGPLDAQERDLVERHAEHGAQILAGHPHPLCDLAGQIALTHHERWDGSGYPRGLSGERIPLAGRIAAIGDVFDALTSDRPYRPAMAMGSALELMERGAASHFDPRLLSLFMRALPRPAVVRETPAPTASPAPALRLAGAFV